MVAAAIAAFAVAIALTAAATVRRRRSRLAAALHELRRPMQGAMLALADPARPACAAACLEQAAGALELLEHELGRGPAPARDVRVAAGDLVEEARLRWQGLAGLQGLSFGVDRPEAELPGDPRRLGAALDNLIANALEHGSGGASLEVRVGAEGTRLTVRNPAAGRRARSAARRRPGRGHGLAIVERIAGELGGQLTPPRLIDAEVEAELSLPPATVEADVRSG